MQKFTVHTGVAAPLLRPNVNTDVLIRIERMIHAPRGQLGPHCFEAWRYRADGSEDPEFVLNLPPYRQATILIAGNNFGCGSSREPAVWALSEMGYACVIAPSFGDIFFNNCFQTGMLPIVLPASVVSELATEAECDPADASTGKQFTIDLINQMIVTPGGRRIAFKIDAAKRRALLEGLEEIQMTLTLAAEIARFQETDARRRPWIYRF
jgi:3-isopropylmalate/(R)-2-methylmalate dehydratase small subunit